jgi:hypothetical protein
MASPISPVLLFLLLICQFASSFLLSKRAISPTGNSVTIGHGDFVRTTRLAGGAILTVCKFSGHFISLFGYFRSLKILFDCLESSETFKKGYRNSRDAWILPDQAMLIPRTCSAIPTLIPLAKPSSKLPGQQTTEAHGQPSDL